MLLFALVFGLLGLIIGSFLNVVILRHGGKNILGRSGCLSCGHELEVIDLVPVISWLVLRGRCRHCGSKISIQYPLVEASNAILFAVIGGAMGNSLLMPSIQSIVLLVDYLVMMALLVCIATYDLKHTIIPDSWAYLFALLALLSQCINFGTGIVQLPLLLLAGPFAALPFAALWFVSGGRWMGLGDAKLALGIGWLLGPVYAWAAILLGFLLGAVVAVCILLPLPYLMRCAQKIGFLPFRLSSARFTMKSEIAFGPFLVAGCVIIWILLLYGVDPLSLYAGALLW